MSKNSEWEAQVAEIKSLFDEMHATRESALRQCRALIQASSKCIRHVHRRQFEDARKLLDQARAISVEARTALGPHPELLHAGYLQDAEKELVEAAAVLLWVEPETRDNKTLLVPDRVDLGVNAVSFLNGLGEAASECRRYVLDEMRQGNLAESERLLRKMEEVYDDLVTFDYPDAMTGGLRRTCDALRAVIERTRSDLTMTRIQHELMKELKRAKDGGA